LVDAHLSGGTGINYNSGEIALDANTDDITEEAGAVNKFFTDTRARNAISADPATGNLAQYDSATGEILVSRSDFRSTFAPQNLAANTWVTLNHALGEKLVHCSAYDSSGNKVQVEVQLTDANNLKVRSVIAVTAAEIVVSI